RIVKEPLERRRRRKRRGAQHDEERQHQKIERKNATDSPHVKDAEIIRGLAVVEQNARDQKTGQDEEEIDAAPRETEQAADGEDGTVRFDRKFAGEIVPDQDEQDG